MDARVRNLNWKSIAANHFPSKSDNACRKRHERLMEQKKAEDWEGAKFELLAQKYWDVREEMWTILGKRVGEKWTVVEQKVRRFHLRNANIQN